MEYFFFKRNNFYNSPIRGGHQVAAAQDFAARQDQADFLAGHELRLEPAFLPRFERKFQLPSHVHFVGGARDLQLGFYFEHQKRKYLCAMGSTLAGSQASSSPLARTS